MNALERIFPEGVPYLTTCSDCYGVEEHLRCFGCKRAITCHTIQRQSHKLEALATQLRNFPGDVWGTPAGDIFANFAGSFWSFCPTRAYIRTRTDLADYIGRLRPSTQHTLAAEFEHVMETLRLGRSDCDRLRRAVPALLIRQGRDQEAYEYMEGWVRSPSGQVFSFGDPSLGHVDLQSRSAFISLSVFHWQGEELSFLVAVTLIKLRLLLDLQKLCVMWPYLQLLLPLELVVKVAMYLPRTDFLATESKLSEILDRNELVERVREMEAEVVALLRSVMDWNPYFWRGLLNPDEFLLFRPVKFKTHSVGEMQAALGWSYLSWAETPGAINFIANNKCHWDIFTPRRRIIELENL